jgi:phage shock protein PspC (stress-responsive transcriptional regulator)
VESSTEVRSNGTASVTASSRVVMTGVCVGVGVRVGVDAAAVPVVATNATMMLVRRDRPRRGAWPPW